MDNTPDWDALSDTPPIAPVAQDRSTPMDSQVADFADEANRRVAAGEDAGTVEQDLQRKVTAAEPKTKAKASTDWDSLFDAPPRASELTSAYQPLEGYQGQVYNSPSAALGQPDQYAAGSQVQGVGDYLANLGTEAAEGARMVGAGIVRGVGEIPQMGRDIAAKFDTLTGGVQGGVPPSAVFTAAAQAQGAPADNTLAQAGAFESEKAAKAQEQAATHLVPAPDENTSGLDQAAYYAQQALVGAPTLAGAMAAGPVGGAALFGATTAGEQYAQKRLAGEAPVSAAASSGIEGAVSALTASLSLESALNPGAIGALKRIAETTGSVEAQSVINEATSIAAEQTIDGKDISADEIKQRLIGAAKGGLPAGVLMGGIGAVAAHDPAAAAAANVERLAANLAPEAVRPTLEERVNAREIPQDQGVLPEQGTVQAGSGETGREGVQFGTQAGPEAGNAREQVNTRGSLPQVGDTIEWQSGMFNQRMQGIVSRLQKDPVTGDLVPIAKVGTRETPVAEWGDSGRIVKSQEAPNVDQNVQPDRAVSAAEEAPQGQEVQAPVITTQRNVNGEYIQVGDQGDGVTHQISHTPSGVFQKTVSESGGRSDTVLNQDGDFIPAGKIRRNPMPDTLPEEMAWTGSAQERQFVAEQAAMTHDLGDESFKERGQIIRDLVTGKIDLAEARKQADALTGEKPSELAAPTDVEAGRAVGADRTEAAIASGAEGVRPESEGALVDENLYSMAAYHGSPHDFEEFSTQHIGAGEGAQAYGHGLYFAGKQEIADHYKYTLAQKAYDKASADAWQKYKADYPTEAKNFDEEMFAQAGRRLSPQELATELQNVLFRDKTGVPQRTNDADLVNHIVANAKQAPSPVGHGYHVELAPEEHEYLDWDKPLSEQSEHVKAALKKLPEGFLERIADHADRFGNNAPEDAPEYYTGGEFYKLASHHNVSDSAEDVSAILHDAGIRGIRYNDAGSRDLAKIRPVNVDGKTQYEVNPEWNARKFGMKVGEKKYFDTQQEAQTFVDAQAHKNYVIFNDRDVKILSKYAQREGAPVSDNLTKAEARDVLTKEFGATAMRKLEANGLNLVPKTAIAGHALTEQQRAGVKGFTPADRSSANIVHDNVTRAELPETAIHEVVHANLDRILPEATRNALASAIQARAQRSPEVRAALDAIPKTTPRSALKEEILAQSMGSLYTQPIGRRVMDAFKLGLNRLGVPLDWLNAHEAAIRQIGIENLRHYAESPKRAPVTTVQLAKPRVRVPVDQVPVNRTGGANDEQRGEAGGRGIPASDAGANAGAVREAGGQALPTEAGARNAAATGVREPPVRTTGEGGVVREPTSIKNETVTAEREARNLGPIETQLGNDFGENNDQAKARLEANPLHGEELTKELIANPRPHTDVESAVLLRDRVRLQNEHADAMKRAETAMDSGDEAEHLRARMTARQIEDKLEANEQAAKHAGSATARGLNARRMMMNEDYSLARIITRARVLNGGDISPEQHAVFEDLAKRIAKTDEAAPKITTRRAVSNDPRAVASEFDQLKAELARISAKPTSQAHYARAEPDVARIIRRMAENRVRAGMTGDDVVNAVHAAVKDYADVSPRDVRDAISGYGTERKPTKDEISIRLTELRKQLREASRREDVANGKRDPVAASRERAVQTRLAGDVKKLKSQLQTKDYERPQRQVPVYDAKTHAMQAERAELARRVNAELEKIRQSGRSPIEKTVDFGLNLRRAVILSSIKTLGKLTSAAGERLGFDPLEEIAGGIAGRLPGVRGIAARAPIEGGVSGHAIAEGFRHALNKESREAAMQKLKTGVDNLDLMFGGKRDYEHTNSWLDYVAQLHGMLKTPAKYARFYSSIAKYAKFERARVIGEGMTPAQADAHMQDPVTIAMMGGKAYENANRSIFMQDNAAVTAYKVMLGYLSKAGAEGSMTRAFSKTAEKTGRYLLPIVRIPTNFVAESGSYGLGAAKALGQVIAAKGVEKLTPDQADYVMRNLKKQTIGAALMYMGYAAADSIGGYYQQGDNKRRLKNAPGDMTIGGVTIPRFLTHNPAMEMLQIGATIRRVQEARAARDEHPVASGVLAAGKGLLSEVPFFDTPSRIGEAATNVKTVGKYLGGEVRSAFIPPDVQNVARMMDKDKKRSPTGFWQEIEAGIPGLRPNVPESRQ